MHIDYIGFKRSYLRMVYMHSSFTFETSRKVLHNNKQNRSYNIFRMFNFGFHHKEQIVFSLSVVNTHFRGIAFQIFFKNSPMMSWKSALWP